MAQARRPACNRPEGVLHRGRRPQRGRRCRRRWRVRPAVHASRARLLTSAADRAMPSALF